MRSASNAHMPASAAAAGGQLGRHRLQLVPGNEQIDTERLPQGNHPVRCDLARAGAAKGQHRILARDVLGLYPEHEAHRLEKRDQASCHARLDMCPHRRAVVDEREMVLDVAVRAEHKRLGSSMRGKMLEALCGQAVQPGEPVGAGDPDHAAVAPVDKSGAAGERALLGEWIAVMPGDLRIWLVSGDRTR